MTTRRTMERVRHGTGAISDSQIPGCTPGSALTLCVAPGVRDYIHVVDLAKGHIAALKKLKENCGCKVPTLGCCQPWGGVGLPVGAEGGPGPSPLDPCPFSSSQIYNLGTGTGYSVLQMVRAMEKASGREVRADLQGQGTAAPTDLLMPPQQPWHRSLSLSGSPQSPRCCSPCRSSTGSRPGGRETWPPATLTPRWPSGSWAGKLPLAWTRCVRASPPWHAGHCRAPVLPHLPSPCSR